MAQGVLLDRRGGHPGRGLQILVPKGYEEGEVRIIGVCHVCRLVLEKETVFGEGEEQAWQRHVGECARAHIDELRALAPSHVDKGTVFDPNEWDKELDDYMRGVGRRMLAEKRWTVKPHERAGFS